MIPGVAGSFATGSGSGGVYTTVTLDPSGYYTDPSGTNAFGLSVLGVMVSESVLLGGGTVDSIYYLPDGADSTVILYMENGHTGSPFVGLEIVQEGGDLVGTLFEYGTFGSYFGYAFVVNGLLSSATLTFRLVEVEPL